MIFRTLVVACLTALFAAASLAPVARAESQFPKSRHTFADAKTVGELQQFYKEIEAALQKHPEVREAVVAAQGDSPAERRLPRWARSGPNPHAKRPRDGHARAGADRIVGSPGRLAPGPPNAMSSPTGVRSDRRAPARDGPFGSGKALKPPDFGVC